MKVAVIGVGSMGINHLRVYTELDGIEVVGASDVSAERMEMVAARFSVRTYTDYKELIQKERPEAVSITVPTSEHETVAAYCLEHGAHVLVEKPIAATVEEGQRLIALAEKLGKPVLYTFGTGDLFFTLMVNMEIIYFAIFLTDVAQFSLITSNIILYITGTADIVCALVAGFILQKVTLKFGGKYRSWLLVGPPIVAPLFVLQFSKIGSEFTAAVILTLGFVASHFLFNIVFAATGSMVGTLSQIPDERTILSTSRAQGMSAAGLIFAVTALPMITYFGLRTNETMGYTISHSCFYNPDDSWLLVHLLDNGGQKCGQ